MTSDNFTQQAMTSDNFTQNQILDLCKTKTKSENAVKDIL
jgi:hypothetical protein